MPRPPRIIGDDVHYHVILRCNNRERLFRDEGDFERLLLVLAEVREQYGFRLYNYDFLNAHVHLMLSTHGGNFIDSIMHDFCFKYARDFNKRHRRIGHLWAHRYRSRVITSDIYGLACLRYQNRNALSLGIVKKPDDWPWSGYPFYAFGRANELLEWHPSYLGLCEDAVRRQFFYRELVNTPIPSDKVPNLLEKGGNKPTVRLEMMIKQVARLRRGIINI